MDRVVDGMGIITRLSTWESPPSFVHIRARRRPNKLTNRNYVAFSGACGTIEQIDSRFYDYLLLF
jgi:hypothetical protein